MITPFTQKILCMERSDLSEFQFEGPMKSVSWEEGQSKENCNDPGSQDDILHLFGNDQAGNQANGDTIM